MKSINPDTPTLRHSDTSSAFTLLEVLVCMAIVAVMVLMVANMFQNASMAWNIGTRKAEINTGGRAATDYIARELSQAVAGPIDSPHLASPRNLKFRQQATGEIRFLALAQEPGSGNRALRDVIFYFGDTVDTLNKIMCCRNQDDVDCYDDDPGTWNHTPANSLLGNVFDLEFFVYSNESDLVNGDYVDVLPADFDELPFCVDIFLELLSADDMETANSLEDGSADQTDFVNRNAKCYSTRVYFPNRDGYRGR